MRSVLRRPPDPVAAEAWFSGPAGRALLASEAPSVRAALQQFPRQRCLWLGPSVVELPEDGMQPPLRLHPVAEGRLGGNLCCTLPLPLASECCAQVVVQHACEVVDDPAFLLDECARVLIPGGWLWLFACNPLAPWRLHWSGHGLRGREPTTWRRWLRAGGLVPEPVSLGLGPGWRGGVAMPPRRGVGLRPAFLLRSEKRSLPLTPVRRPRPIGLHAGTPA